MSLNRTTIKKAMESDDAQRLLQIAREHTMLVREMHRQDGQGLPVRVMYDPLTMGIYDERIRQLQDERDEILHKYS